MHPIRQKLSSPLTKFALVIVILTLSACASVNQKTLEEGFRFNAIEVLNRTQADIFNMQIEVTKFHRKFACGVILQSSLCMNGFHARALQGNEVLISWEQKGQKHSFGPLKAEAPAHFDDTKVYAIQFVFVASDSVELLFKASSF